MYGTFVDMHIYIANKCPIFVSIFLHFPFELTSEMPENDMSYFLSNGI